MSALLTPPTTPRVDERPPTGREPSAVVRGAVEGVRRPAGVAAFVSRHVPGRHPPRPRGAHRRDVVPGRGHRPHRRRQLDRLGRVVATERRHHRGDGRGSATACGRRASRSRSSATRSSCAARARTSARTGAGSTTRSAVPSSLDVIVDSRRRLRRRHRGHRRRRSSTATTARSRWSRLSGSMRCRPTTTDASRAPGCARRPCAPTPTTGGCTLGFVAPPTSVLATSNNGSVEVVVPDDGTAYRLDDGHRQRQPEQRAPARRRHRRPLDRHPHRQRQRHRPHRLSVVRYERRRLQRVGGRDRHTDRPVDGGVLLVVPRLLGLVALGDDGAHAAGGEAVDGTHLEQRAGLHLEVEDAEVVVLVDHPAQPPHEVRVRRRLRTLLALEERVRRRHHADVVVDAELSRRGRPG